MNPLRLFANGNRPVHATTAWYLAEIGEYNGKQALFTQQSPQRLSALRQHARIESALSSNRIEGVTIEPARVKDVLVSPRLLFRDHDEEVVRGYRDALTMIHQTANSLAIDETTITRLHALHRGQIWDAGKYKEKDSDIIERYADGRERIRFRTDGFKNVPAAMDSLVGRWKDCLQQRWTPELVALAAFNLNFLCIHPFRDGNGRVSSLLWLLQSYHLGCEVGRYVSFERLVEQNKDRYYETLEQSSHGWRDCTHDPWPYVNFVLFIFKTAYREFTERLGDIRAPRGAKRDLVLHAIDQLVRADPRGFTIAQLERECPGVSRDMVRRVLREQQALGRVVCVLAAVRALHGLGSSPRVRHEKG